MPFPWVTLQMGGWHGMEGMVWPSPPPPPPLPCSHTSTHARNTQRRTWHPKVQVVPEAVRPRELVHQLPRTPAVRAHGEVPRAMSGEAR